MIHADDDTELERSVEALRIAADMFVSYGVKAAIEPIRAAEVSFVHTVGDALAYIEAVNHPGSATSTATCITCRRRSRTSGRRSCRPVTGS